LRRRRPTLGASRLKRPISIGEKAFSQRPACTDPSSRRRRPTPGAQAPVEADFNRREGLRPTVGLRRPKTFFASAKADARRVAPGKADFNRRESLRPTVGLRRPRNVARVGEGRRLARRAWEGRFQSARRPSANGRPAPTEERSLASAKADARRASACRGRFQSARRPSANARPAPTEKRSLRRQRGACVGEGRRRPGASRLTEGRFQSARRPSTNGRPAPAKDVPCVGEGRCPARKRLRRPISIGEKAFSQRSACADRKTFSASAKADARRVAPGKADFNRRESGRPVSHPPRSGASMKADPPSASKSSERAR
jgi:hypothetical protein